jgi:hypothetical protein
MRPDFSHNPWNQGRLYQQDIRIPVEDPEEEVPAECKKRRKYNRRRTEAPKLMDFARTGGLFGNYGEQKGENTSGRQQNIESLRRCPGTQQQSVFLIFTHAGECREQQQQQ